MDTELLEILPLELRFTYNKDDPTNGLMWLRGDTAERGLQSLNFQGLGVNPWLQQRVDPSLLRIEHDQQYQVIAAAALQDIRNGDPLKQQLLQFQQPSTISSRPLKVVRKAEICVIPSPHFSVRKRNLQWRRDQPAASIEQNDSGREEGECEEEEPEETRVEAA